jgi:hypothetical protein
LTPCCGLEVQKPTQALFEKKTLWRGMGLYKYSMNNILKTAKFLPAWGFNQIYFPGL